MEAMIVAEVLISSSIRGKWRIPNGKEGEWSDLKFGAPRW
jgi:hypothetical protein